MNTTLQLRLRNYKDEDIKQALAKFPNIVDLSEVLREALRHYLFGEETPIKNKKELKPLIVKEMPKITFEPLTPKESNSDDKLDKLLNF